jgi:hypothetical protein
VRCRNIKLICGNLAEEDILLRERLDSLAEMHEKFEVVHTLAAPDIPGQVSERVYPMVHSHPYDKYRVYMYVAYLTGKGVCIRLKTPALEQGLGRRAGLRRRSVHQEVHAIVTLWPRSARKNGDHR